MRAWSRWSEPGAAVWSWLRVNNVVVFRPLADLGGKHSRTVRGVSEGRSVMNEQYTLLFLHLTRNTMNRRGVHEQEVKYGSLIKLKHFCDESKKRQHGRAVVTSQPEGHRFASWPFCVEITCSFRACVDFLPQIKNIHVWFMGLDYR